MKVKLTDRNRVDAEGKWFTAVVQQDHVIVRTIFGRVSVHRTRAGLEVRMVRETPDTFFQDGSVVGHAQCQGEQLDFTAPSKTTTLRNFGAVTLGELDNPTIAEHIRPWIQAGKHKPDEVK